MYAQRDYETDNYYQRQDLKCTLSELIFKQVDGTFILFWGSIIGQTREYDGKIFKQHE